MSAALPLVRTVSSSESNGAPPQGHESQPARVQPVREQDTREQDAREQPARGHSAWEPPARALSAARRGGPTPSIADFYADLMQPLNERQRKGLIARLSVGYFEGWRPTRQEMAEIVALELRRSHPRR